MQKLFVEAWVNISYLSLLKSKTDFQNHIKNKLSLKYNKIKNLFHWHKATVRVRWQLIKLTSQKKHVTKPPNALRGGKPELTQVKHLSGAPI
jgi:hypothetical protein